MNHAGGYLLRGGRFSAQLHSDRIVLQCPNGHPEGAPFRHYGTCQSEEAIKHAGEVLAFVRARMAGKAGS